MAVPGGDEARNQQGGLKRMKTVKQRAKEKSKKNNHFLTKHWIIAIESNPLAKTERRRRRKHFLYPTIEGFLTKKKVNT